MSGKELAINGGRPVRDTFLPYSRQTVTDADKQAVLKVLGSDFLTTGPAVAGFEKDIAAVAGVNGAAAVNSGTAALHCMLAACNIGPGDEVIVPAITFAATSNAALYLGAKPVFADIDRDTLLIDLESVSRQVTPRTKAIIAVDFAGQPADYDGLRRIVGEGVRILADAAHSIGAQYCGKPSGSLAEASTFSFHPVKPVAAGEGGAVVSGDPEIVRRSKVFRNHGITADHLQRSRQNTWQYEMVELGFNYRLSDIHAALGSSQLKSLSAGIERRNAVARKYDEAFGGVEGIRPLTQREGVLNAYHLYVIEIDTQRFTTDRAGFFHALRAENIGVNVHYAPVPWHPYYRGLGYEPGNWPVAEQAYERILSLPLWAGMSDRDVDDVVEAVGKVATAFRR